MNPYQPGEDNQDPYEVGYKAGTASRDAEVAELKKDAIDFHGQVNRLTEWNNNLVSHRDELKSERDQLRDQLEASRANDRTAMLYLSEIKSAAGHDGDFPSLVLKVSELREQVAMLRDALKEIRDDYLDRFDMESPSTNPGIKSAVAQATEALAATEPKPKVSRQKMRMTKVL